MSSMLDTPEFQTATRFVELTLEKRALKERLKEVEGHLRTLEPALVGYLSAASLPCIAVKNYLVAAHREPWIYPITGVSRQMVCEALKISGLARMVSENYSTQALTAHIKSLEEHHKLISGLQSDGLDKLLPPALAHILHIKPAYGIRVQKKERSYGQEFEEQETNDEFPE
jgi:hypothetical protein